MKAALGILLIVGGFTIGYLVLIGKLPTTTTPQMATEITGHNNTPGGGTSGGNLTPGIGGAALIAAKGMVF